MLYTEKDIDFSIVTPTEFENLCFDIVRLSGFLNVTWRQGGADNGRDIDAKLPFTSIFTPDHYTNWHFECKHYSGGVPPEELTAKVAWADAEGVDFLLFFVTSYLSNGAKVWLEKIRKQYRFKILCVEGIELKSRILTFQHLIPKYFSGDNHIRLYQEIKRQNLIYYIRPSLQVLTEILQNVSPSRFELDDVTFLLFSIYANYNFERINAENDFVGYIFDENLPKPLFGRFKQISNQRDCAELVKDINFLGGDGFIDDLENEENYSEKYYQSYELHLNYTQEERWQLGNYLLIILDKTHAIEILKVGDDWANAYTFYHEKYGIDVLRKILSKFYDKEFIEKVIDNSVNIL